MNIGLSQYKKELIQICHIEHVFYISANDFEWKSNEIAGIMIDKNEKCLYYKDKESGEPPPYKRGIKKAVIPNHKSGK